MLRLRGFRWGALLNWDVVCVGWKVLVKMVHVNGGGDGDVFYFRGLAV